MHRRAEIHEAEHIIYLDNREHSLVIIRVGVDFKALSGISFNYRVDSSSSSRGRVVPVVDCEVDHHTCRPLVDKRFKLRRQRERLTLERTEKNVRNKAGFKNSPFLIEILGHLELIICTGTCGIINQMEKLYFQICV